jgi:hypothetical protein
MLALPLLGCLCSPSDYAAGVAPLIFFTLAALSTAIDVLLTDCKPHGAMYTADSGFKSAPGTRYLGALAALGYVLLIWH